MKIRSNSLSFYLLNNKEAAIKIIKESGKSYIGSLINKFGSFSLSSYNIKLLKKFLNENNLSNYIKNKPTRGELYQECYEEAKKYKTKRDFRELSSTLYNRARSHGWLKDYNWLKTVNSPKKTYLTKLSKGQIKWATYEDVEKEAKKYILLKDFRLKSSGAYKVARQKGWLSSYTWLNRGTEDVTKEIWCVYVYIIDNKYIYVGLSVDMYRRDREHNGFGKNGKRDQFYRFCKENGLTIPKYIIIEDHINATHAQELEDRIKNEYLQKPGWIVINKGKTGIGTGSLGSGIRKWDKQSCYEVALKCKTRKEFKKKYPRAYNVSHKNGWFPDYTWLPKKTKPENSKSIVQYDTNGNFINKYESISEAERFLKKEVNTPIRKICRNKKGTAYGYIWRFLTDVLDGNGEILKKIDPQN